MKYSFYAIFEQDIEDPTLINVSFPDIIGAYTFGVGVEEAMIMAKDLLLGLLEDSQVQKLVPTPLEEISSVGKILLVEVEK